MSELKEIDREKLADLLAKVQAATGPDRRLDVMIGVVTDLHIEGMPNSFRQYVDIMGVDDAADHAERHQSILRTELPRYTASIDAALALVEKLLPDWRWGLVRQKGTGTDADGSHFWMEDGDGFRTIEIGPKPTDCIAILSALLSSLKAST